MDHPLVTLTTDWGSKDFFAGMVKGRLYSMIDGVQVVDITHNIEPFHQGNAAFVVKNGCLDFPPGTIHIVDVNTTEDKDTSFVVVCYHEQFFICTDNGLPYAVFGDQFDKVVQLNVYQDSNFFTFGAYNLFCRVAQLIAGGTPVEELGVRVDTLKPSTPLKFILRPDSLLCYVQYVDNYGNAYLNITYDHFMEILDGRSFTLMCKGNRITSVSDSYLDSVAQPSRPYHTQAVLTVSATGYLQIALQKASAQQLIGLTTMDSVEFLFK